MTTRWVLWCAGAAVQVVDGEPGAVPFEVHPSMLWIDVGDADVVAGAVWDGHEFRNPDDPRGPPTEPHDPREDRAALAQAQEPT